MLLVKGVRSVRWIAVALVACVAGTSQTRAEPTSADHTGSGRAAFLPLLRLEAVRVGLPPDIADAVAAVESGYDPTRVGGVGEVGLMQVRPETAAMLGYSGSVADLMKPATNIHYGVAYLAGAWQLANGDLCRALMKYRAGHGETVMSLRSTDYCARAKAHLASVGSPFASSIAAPAFAATPALRSASATRGKIPRSLNGTSLRGTAFWAAQEARVSMLRARVARNWRRIASR